MRRKHEQAKAYAKIIKYKRTTGQAQEIEHPQPTHPHHTHQEPLPDIPKNEEFEDPFEDEYEEEEGWISASDDEQEDEEGDGTMMSEEKEKATQKEAKEGKWEKAVFLGSSKNLAKGEVL